jgi:hypothetical protein
MSHYVEYRTQQTQAFGFCSPSEIKTTFPLAQNVATRGIRNHTHSDFGPGFCHAENLVTVPSHQTHLYSEALTPRPNKRSHSLHCESRGFACLPSSLAEDNTDADAVAAANTCCTQRILSIYSTSFSHLQRSWNCTSKAYTSVHNMHPCLPSLPWLCARSHLAASLCSRLSSQTQTQRWR